MDEKNNLRSITWNVTYSILVQQEVNETQKGRMCTSFLHHTFLLQMKEIKVCTNIYTFKLFQ